MKVETDRIEYKVTLSKGFTSEVVAFLNYHLGGTIYIGIDNEGNIMGVDNVGELQLKIKDKIKNSILPSVLGLFDCIVENKDGKNIIKIIISSGPEKPYYLKEQGMTPKGCFIRVGSSKEPMNQDLIDRIYARRIRNSLKNIESPRNDLTFRQLKIFYEEHGYEINNNFLQSLELINNGKYNYNAYLLADDNGNSIKVAKYRGKDKCDLIENYELGYCSLVKAVSRVIDKLENENKNSALITYKNRIEKPLVDHRALREAVINAIVHNDYSSGVPPVFEIFSDRITVTSCGTLPSELSKEDFFSGVSCPKNKELMRVFKDLEIVEQLGSGMNRIMKACKKEDFEFMDNFIRINFYFNTNVIDYLNDKTGELDDNEIKKVKRVVANLSQDNKTYNEIRFDRKKEKQELILEFCETPRSTKEIMDFIGLTHRPTFIYTYLNPLVSSGKLEMTIPDNPNSMYQKYITSKK